MQTMNNNSGRPDFLSGVSNWFAGVGALVAAFFVTPYVYGTTVDSVRAFALTHYGFDFGVGVLWGLLTLTCIALGSAVALKLIMSAGTISFFRGLFR